MADEANERAGRLRLRVWGVLAVWLAMMLAPLARGAELQVVRHPLAAGAQNAAPLGRLAGTNRLHLAIGLPLRDPEGLTKLLRELYDPSSPNYHHYLSVAEFTERFGPTPGDYEAVAAFAQSHGLQVVLRHPNRLVLDVEGTAGEVEQALHVQLNRYAHPAENREFYAPDGDPKLELGVSVLGISGLDNYALPRPRVQAKPLTGTADAMPNTGSGPGGTYMGQNFRKAYAAGTTLTGTGQIVGLLEFDGYTASDITYYEAAAGLPNVPLSNVLLDGFGGLPTGTGGEVEVSLDIEMAISMAPSLSQTIIYEAGPYGDWHDMLSRMATDNLAKQISCSWYIPDGPADPVADGIWQEMAVQGQTFFNASGDGDSYYGLISFPGDSPYITQVGGTTLTMSGVGGSYQSETVWNWGEGVGSGGGISTQYPIPSWQTNVSMAANYGSTTMRNTPDVAMTADNVYVRVDGQDWDVGGTSCAAPLWAGFMALVNQQAVIYGQPLVGFFNPTVYGVGGGSHYAAAFHDITTGNNGTPTHFPAVAGYDLATGWGTPNGQPLINAIVPPDTLVISPDAGFTSAGAVGGPFTESAQTFLFTNVSGSNLSWSVSNSAVWLSVTPAGGTLGGSGMTNVVVSLNATASNLPPGNYAAQVLVTNQTSGFVHHVGFGLTVHDPLVFTPGSGFGAVGPMGGPFNISMQSYALSNSGLSSLSWLLTTNNAAWLSAAPAGGTLGPGTGTNVVVSLNGVASNLVAALYDGDIWFSNQTSGLSQELQFSLRTGQLPVGNDGFELGSFAGWTLSGNTIGEQVTANSTYVHTGLYGAELGPEGSLGHLSQSLVTVPGQVYLISFWLENPGITVANEFQVNWEGSTVSDQVNVGTMGWTNVQLEVAALTTNSVLDFGFENNGYDFGLDDVAVYEVTGVATNPPVITSQPMSQTLTAGWTAQLTSGVTGIAPFFYQWQRGGSNLAGATNLTLLYSPVTVGEAGAYRLVVSNAFGATNSSNAVLTVNVPVCDPAASGLGGWWAGEGNADDSFGTNNGTLQSGVSFSGGEVGQAFSFDGSTGYVEIPNAPNLDGDGQVTIDFWMYSNPTNPIGSRIEGLVTSQFYGVEMAPGNNLYMYLSTNGGSSFLLTTDVNPGGLTFPTGQWHHVAATYDGTNMQMYLDGQPAGSPRPAAGMISMPQAGSFVTLGSENGRAFAGSGRYYQGLLDEVDIFNRALTASEIAAIYAAGSSGKCPSPPVIVLQPTNDTLLAGGTAAFGVAASGTQPLSYQWFQGTNLISAATNATATNATLVLPNVQLGQSGGLYSVVVSNVVGSTNSSNALLTVNPPPPCDPSPAGLVGWWAGEGNANDSSGTNNGTLQGGVSFSGGEVGQAISFDGSTGYVEIPNAPNLNVSHQMTIDFWMYSNPANPIGSRTEGLVTAQYYGIEMAPGNNLYLYLSTNGGSSFLLTADVNAGGLTFPAGQWHHVAATYDGTNLQMYLDGRPRQAVRGLPPGTLPRWGPAAM